MDCDIQNRQPEFSQNPIAYLYNCVVTVIIGLAYFEFILMMYVYSWGYRIWHGENIFQNHKFLPWILLGSVLLTWYAVRKVRVIRILISIAFYAFFGFVALFLLWLAGLYGMSYSNSVHGIK